MANSREIGRFLLHPIESATYLLSRFVYPIFLRRQAGVDLKGSIEIRGFPLVFVQPGGRLVVGDGTKLNSRNEDYFVNMHSPVKILVERNARLTIGADTRIHGSCIHALEDIRIGSRCLIAANTQIIDGGGHDLAFDAPETRISTKGRTKPVVIEDNVWIGANCLILPGVHIGEGAVIGAGSVVTRTIPPRSLAAGNPATVVRGTDRETRPSTS